MTTTNATHRVQEALDAAGRKRSWLYRRTGVSQRQMYRYMNGAPIPQEWMAAAADALGLPQSYLFPDAVNQATDGAGDDREAVDNREPVSA